MTMVSFKKFLQENYHRLTEEENPDSSLDNIHPDTHTALAQQGPHQVRMALVALPYLHPDAHTMLASFSDHADWSVARKLPNQKEELLGALVARPDLNPNYKTHELISTFGSSKVRRALIDRPDLHPDAHGQLATHDVDIALVARPDLNPNRRTHLQISQHGSDDVRMALLARPDFNREAHEMMALASSSDRVHNAMLALPNLHPDARKILLDRQSKRKV